MAARRPKTIRSLQSNHRSFRRAWRAQWRDAQVLFLESRAALTTFLALVGGGALLFYWLYTDPETGQPISLAQAIYAAFAMVFFQAPLAFPEQGLLQLLYFILPIVGLIAVADGIIRFGVALTNKQERGQKWQVAVASTYNQHVIVCGVGKVGFRVILELLKFNREIVAIESNPAGRFVEKALALGIPVIIADARRSENLVKAGIERAAAVIPCTEDELTNLDIALDAREINPQAKIVMRMFDPDLARRIEKGFGIYTAFSVSALAAPTFAAASMRANVYSSFYVGDELLNISETVISPNTRLDGWTVANVEQAFDLSVVGLVVDGKTILHPGPDQGLHAGYRLLVLADMDTLQRLDALNQPPGR